MAVVVSFIGKVDFKDVAKAEKELAKFGKQSDAASKSFAQGFKDIAAKAAVAGAAVAGIGIVINKAIQSASALSEAQSKVTQVFGDQAESIFDWGKTSAEAFGQSETQALSAVGTYGNLLQAFGITAEKASEMSKAMVELAADLASFNDTSIEDALQALQSGLSGETEPLKRYGVALNDARLKTEALSLGLYEGTGALSVAAKAQASYALILKDTTLAQGDFERTSDGLANQQRILQAQFDNLITQLGGFLLPVALKVVQALNGMVGVAQRLTTAMGENKEAVIVATGAVIALTLAMSRNAIVTAATTVAFTAQRIAMGLYITAYATATGATTALSAAMRLIPWVAAATALAAFVVVLNDGAKSHKAYITETENNLRATNKLRDANGNFTKEAIALGMAMRGSRGAIKDNRDAISGTAAAAIQAGNAMGSTLTPNTYDAGDAAGYAAKSYLELFESIWNAKRIASDFANTSGTVTSALSDGVKAGASPLWAELPGKYGAIDKAARGAASGASAAGGAISKSAEDAKAAIANYKESFKSVREYLNESVEEIKIKMADMATSVSSSLMRGFQLGETAEEFGEDGARIGGTFIEKLQAQAEKVTNFAAKIKELMALGLNVNSPLMQAVIAEGAGSGTAIAQHLIDSGAAGIEQATGMLTAAQGAADEIGLLAATNFYGAGLESAQQTVQAFVDRFGVGGKGRERLMTLMDNLSAAMNRSATITVTTVNRVVNETVGAGSAGKTIVGATGGIVNRPTFALIGEAGPEAVIPLSQSSGNDPLPMIGGGRSNAGTTINLTVNAGMGTQGAEVGRQIVDALKAYERRNGSVYVAA